MSTSTDLKALAKANLEKAQREKARRLNENYEPFWQPQPGPQSLAFESVADIIGYGGAAGGGKSDLLIGSAFEKHTKSLILRWEATQLTDLFNRAVEIANGRGHENENLKFIRGLPRGKKIEFGGVGNERRVSKWKGRPHDYLGIDEATEFPRQVVTLLMTWNRSTIPGQHSQTLMTFNPPTTPEGMWVIDFFGPWLDPKHPRPALPGELRWYAMLGGKEVERPDGKPFKVEGDGDDEEPTTPQSRTFFPARVEDNSYFTGTGYKSKLQALPEPFRSQFLKGDFAAAQPEDPWQVIPTAWVKAAQARWKETTATTAAALPPMTAIGVDVAMGGNDKTVIACRYGTWFADLIKIPGSETKDSNEAVAAIEQALLTSGVGERRKQIAINIDGIGVGAGVVTAATNAGLRAKSIVFSEGTTELDASNNFGFANVRALAYWRLREALDPVGGDNLALPDDDPELLADLTVARFSIRSVGIQVEPKADIKKRIGRSPDSGDAVVLAHFTAQNDFSDIMDYYRNRAEERKNQK